MKKLLKIIICLNIGAFASLHAGIVTPIQWILANGKPTLDAIDNMSVFICHKVFKRDINSLILPEHLQKLLVTIEAPAIVQEFVRQELKSVLPGINLKIYLRDSPGECPQASTNGLDTITLTRDSSTKELELEKLLSKDSLSPEEKCRLDMWRFILYHEAGHIKNNDFLYKGIVSAIVSFFTWIVLRRAQNYMDQNCSSNVYKFLKIPAALGIGIFNILLLRAYGRYREQLADNFAPSNKDILEGGIEAMESFKAQNERIVKFFDNYIDNEIKDHKVISRIIVRMIMLYCWASHPSNELRLRNIQKRLQKLRQSVA